MPRQLAWSSVFYTKQDAATSYAMLKRPQVFRSFSLSLDWSIDNVQWSCFLIQEYTLILYFSLYEIRQLDINLVLAMYIKLKACTYTIYCVFYIGPRASFVCTFLQDICYNCVTYHFSDRKNCFNKVMHVEFFFSWLKMISHAVKLTVYVLVIKDIYTTAIVTHSYVTCSLSTSEGTAFCLEVRLRINLIISMA